MTISNERIARALRVYHNEPPAECLLFNRMQAILASDDAFRAAESAPVGDSEPRLPEGVVFHGPNERVNSVPCYHRFESWINVYDDGIGFRADDLEAIAKHMRWHAAQAAKPAAPEVTDAMVEAAVHASQTCKAFDYRLHYRAILTAALAAAPSAKGT